jgi:hypothetical protein
VIFPFKDGEAQMVGFPLVFPMGWKQFPPILTSATATVANLANRRLLVKEEVHFHLLDEVAETVIPEELVVMATHDGEAPLLVPDTERHPHQAVPVPVKRWDVYVDNFLGTVQGNQCQR